MDFSNIYSPNSQIAGNFHFSLGISYEKVNKELSTTMWLQIFQTRRRRSLAPRRATSSPALRFGCRVASTSAPTGRTTNTGGTRSCTGSTDREGEFRFTKKQVVAKNRENNGNLNKSLRPTFDQECPFHKRKAQGPRASKQQTIRNVELARGEGKISGWRVPLSIQPLQLPRESVPSSNLTLKT